MVSSVATNIISAFGKQRQEDPERKATLTISKSKVFPVFDARFCLKKKTNETPPKEKKKQSRTPKTKVTGIHRVLC